MQNMSPLQVESTEPQIAEATRVVADLAVSIRPPSPAGNPNIRGYDVLQVIGRGGMSQIYLARQRKPNRLAAIKMIHPEQSLHEQIRRRFLREALSIARLRHANVVEIYEIGESEGMLYLCLEYVAGGSLESFIRKQRPTPKMAAEIMRQLATAVQAAHERSIVHRDLKPANVLCIVPDKSNQPTEPGNEPEIRVKITDFGLARIISEASEETRSGAPIGTPGYMSPEQAWGRHDEIGAPTDIYGLGAILYEMLTGQPPFRGETMSETVEMVLREPPAPPRELAPHTPPDLERICLRCLQKDPDRRYASARDLDDDLARFLSGRAIAARGRNMLSRWLRRCRRRPLRSLAYLSAAVFVVAGSLSLMGLFPGEHSAGQGVSPAEIAKVEPNAEPPPLNDIERLLLRVQQNPTLPENARQFAELGDEKLMWIVQQHPHDFAVLMAAGDACLLHLQRPDDALPHYREARRIADEQIKADMRDAEGWNHLAWAHERLGDVEVLKKDPANARREYEGAIGIREQLLQDGQRLQHGLDLARVCGKQAELYMQEKDNQTAYLLYARKLDLLAQQLPQAPQLATEIRHAHQRLAHIYRLLGNADGAAFHDKAAALIESKTP